MGTDAAEQAISERVRFAVATLNVSNGVSIVKAAEELIESDDIADLSDHKEWFAKMRQQVRCDQ